MANATLTDRLDTYAVAPAADYRETIFVCPTNGRRYLSVTPPIDYGDAVATGCYWCDSQLHVRGRDRDHHAAEPQVHIYPVEAGHAAQTH